jgi:hypothetical protein
MADITETWRNRSLPTWRDTIRASPTSTTLKRHRRFLLVESISGQNNQLTKYKGPLEVLSDGKLCI